MGRIERDFKIFEIILNLSSLTANLKSSLDRSYLWLATMYLYGVKVTGFNDKKKWKTPNRTRFGVILFAPTILRYLIVYFFSCVAKVETRVLRHRLFGRRDDWCTSKTKGRREGDEMR